MPSNTSPQVPAGRVVAQAEAIGQDASGNYVPGVNVTATLANGGPTFTVFIPKASYSPDAVKAALEEQASKVAAIHSLTFGG